ncbi:MAG TPA: glycosyltransferase family 39 protein [Solirubrobacteraceae bacterium]|nr:glycosyltransferase family 39 protein [Solirubrobacteraceae bacterium]
MRRGGRRAEWAAVAAITLGAAALRLLYIGKVSPDPFYDAAVRSMALSWHNFFLGAFEPSGSVSIDKPPIDLWLQVASVKLLGFNSTTLKLPEAFAGIASVPLLFAAVRRMWSATAGLAAAAALAVLPVEVITSRSDTMDAVMMLTLVLALLALVRAAETGRRTWLLAGAAALGLAFNVKLLESLVALPGLAVFLYLGLPGTRAHRLSRMALAAVLYVAVALSWLTATLLVPAHDRPYAIGSSNGSAWNAAFVFNGTDRLGGKSPEPQPGAYKPGHRYPVATQADRDRIPIVPPSATRLLSRIGPLSGQRLGMEVLLALLLGIPALLWGARGGRGWDANTDPAAREARARMRRASAAGVGLWMLTGIVLFSHMARLHPRYVEGFTPAVAAMLGIGVAWALAPSSERRRANVRLAVLTGSLLVAVLYGERLLYGTPGIWWLSLLCALGAITLAALARAPGAPSPAAPASTPGAPSAATPAPRAPRRDSLARAGAVTLTLVSILAIPLRADVTAIETHITFAGYVGAMPSEQQRLVSSYVRAHQRGARYELAAASATAIGSLIVQDAGPVLVLTTYAGRVFTPIDRLRRLTAQGQVRYAFLNSVCGRRATHANPACSAPVKWVREHASDVSREAGLSRTGLLYRLPGVAP